MDSSKQLIEGYIQWIEERMEAGFEPHLITFMFNPMPGAGEARWAQMTREIDKVYGRVLSRTFRVPDAEKNQPLRPLLIVAPDFPIFRRDRDRLTDIVVNDGLHAHGIWLMPLESRMRPQHLSGHFLNFQERYAGPGKAFARINSEPITHHTARAVDYALKGIKTGRLAPTDIAVWPRSRWEK